MSKLHRGLMSTAATIMALQAGAFAQTSVGQPSDEIGETADEIIVTGVARPTTKFESTASVTSLPPEEIERAAPRSTAEAFRSLPGIQVEPSSGDANTNLKVRGLPISSGGSRYVSFQEDGFPSLLIGDISFATADSFIRFDRNIKTVQAIRGGSASTTAPNAPGGIINLISKDGSQEGGTVAFTTGINFESFRGDAEYGLRIDDTWSAHVGGFYRSGEGVRDTIGNVEEGGQIKATLLGEFDRGSLAIHGKYLNDTVPTYLPIPAVFNGDGFDPAGVDFGDGTLFLGVTDFANRVDGVDAVENDGFDAEVASIAVVGDYELTDNFTAAISHRTAKIEGNFASPFPANVLTAEDDESIGPGEAVVEIVYFNTELRDLDNSFTDLSLTGDFDFVTITGGVEFASQNIDMNWNFNQYYRTLDEAFAITDIGDSVGGVLFANPAFGNCCTRDYDFDVDLTSPYMNLSAEYGDFTFDASYRRFDYDVEGTFAEVAVSAPQDIDGDGAVGANEQAVNDIGPSSPADYEVDFNAFSVGLNYRVTSDIAIFGNYAEGGSLSSPERITGSILASGDINAEEAAFSKVEQWEVGVKYTNGPANLFVTYFNADTSEAAEFEVTTQTIINNDFESQGVEIEGSYELANGLGLRATATFTDAEITGSNVAANIGNQPRRQADYIFNVSPYYEGRYAGRDFTVGANFFGTDEVFVQDSNELEFDSYTVASLYGFVDLTERLRIQADINNLFDTEGFTEGEEGSASPGDFVRIRPINGRTATATVSYRF